MKFTPEHRAALSAAHTGKKLSEEHNAAIHEGCKRRWTLRKEKEELAQKMIDLSLELENRVITPEQFMEEMKKLQEIK
jgi:hypothetical protein